MESNDVEIKTVASVGIREIFWGVFLALWSFALSAAALWFGVIHLLRATGDIQ